MTETTRPKLLIVDDERVITDTLAMILSQYGYECFTAYDGWEELRKAREVKPDMIISGVINGGPNGIEMAIQIHAEMPETKIVLFSGQAATAGLMEKAIAEGHSFLAGVPIYAKPIHPQDLLNFLQSNLNPAAFVGKPGGTPPPKPRVLIAAGERAIADTLAMVLNQGGFEARAVYSGEDAVEVAPGFKPDMFYSDVIMLDLTGIDAAIRIRQILPSIKVLLFSGSASTADLLEKAHAQGYDFEILAVPVPLPDVISRIRAALGMTAPTPRPESVPRPKPPSTSRRVWDTKRKRFRAAR